MTPWKKVLTREKSRFYPSLSSLICTSTQTDSLRRVLPLVSSVHFRTVPSLGKYGVRFPKFIWAPCAQLYTHWLRPRNPPPSPPHLGSYTRALLVSQGRRNLFVTSCASRILSTREALRGSVCTLYIVQYFVSQLCPTTVSFVTHLQQGADWLTCKYEYKQKKRKYTRICCTVNFCNRSRLADMRVRVHTEKEEVLYTRICCTVNFGLVSTNIKYKIHIRH
jgi:hypothetical protein